MNSKRYLPFVIWGIVCIVGYAIGQTHWSVYVLYSTVTVFFAILLFVDIWREKKRKRNDDESKKTTDE